MRKPWGLDSDQLAALLLNAHQKTSIKINTIWVLLKEWWGDEQSQTQELA